MKTTTTKTANTPRWISAWPKPTPEIRAPQTKNALSDVYVKPFAGRRIAFLNMGKGLAFITNNGFLGGVAFDGMKAFDAGFFEIYHLDLKAMPELQANAAEEEAGNVFDDTIRVGVGVTFLIKKKEQTSQTEIYLYSVDDYLQADEKKAFLDKSEVTRMFLSKKDSTGSEL